MEKKSIIIVGGGIAGLVAATELSPNFNIILLEAGDRLGGRILTVSYPGFSRMIEAGAEFIHGHCEETIQLLKKAGIPFTPVEGKFLRNEKGQWKEQHEMIEGWDDLLKQMKSIPEDMTLRDFLEKYYNKPGDAALRRHIIAYTEGFDIADPGKASVYALCDEWSQEEEENFRIQGGYGSLIDYLEKECRLQQCSIRTGDPVTKIEWDYQRVSVHTFSGNNYGAEKLLITIPTLLLQQKNRIKLDPAIDDYIKATYQIGMGSVIKVMLEFSEMFWKKKTGFIFSDQVIPTWWTQLPDETPLLTGWLGGPPAARLSANSEDEIIEMALGSLAGIFNLEISSLKNNLKAGLVTNWQNNELSHGGYTYAMPGSKEARKLLNTPVDNTVFFAGEALYEGKSPGTVEAAIVSAKVAVKRISPGWLE